MLVLFSANIKRQCYNSDRLTIRLTLYENNHLPFTQGGDTEGQSLPRDIPTDDSARLCCVQIVHGLCRAFDDVQTFQPKQRRLNALWGHGQGDTTHHETTDVHSNNVPFTL